MPNLSVSPLDGSLTLSTGVEGRAAKAGHALTIAVGDWSANASFEGGQPTSMSLRAALSSLEIVSGEGGLKPLSDKDKRTVKSTALEVLSAAKHPEVSFTSTSVTARSDGYDVAGQLELAGVTRPLTVQLTVVVAGEVATVTAVVPITQTDFGIKPYTGLMGGLKVRDRVDLALSVKTSVPG